MTTSNPIQTPLERPSIEVGDPPLRIFATRDGDRVTGRVEFPYETYGRTSCPIDYRSTRPSDSSFIPHPSSLRSTRRLDAVKRYQQLCTECPATGKIKLLDRICLEFGRRFGQSALRTWITKYELEGESGLQDRYVKPSKKVLLLDAKQATDAVTICAWWVFRIGNSDIIDTKMIHTTASSFILPPSSPLPDILATIDCYYSYPCDRRKMPFKPFARWTKYDFEKWLYRACDESDYRRGLLAMAAGRVPLQAPISNPQSTVPDARTRKRDVNSRPNRQALRNLASDPPPPSSLSTLRAVGLKDAARRIVAGSAPGIPALCANNDPQTMAEALGTLDDSYRTMLLYAAKGDRGCREEAIATLPMWWDAIPESLRGNIEFKVDAWRRDHPRVNGRAVAQRKVFMLLPHLHNPRGLRRLAVAARIPT